MVNRLVILGAGGYGRTVADVAHNLGYSIIVLDDANLAHPISSLQSYTNSSSSFIPAFGNNTFRME